MKNAQNKKSKQIQNVSRETIESIVNDDIKRLSKQNDAHYLFALEVTSKQGIQTYFAWNDKNLWLLHNLGLSYQDVIVVSEYPILDEKGLPIKSYKNLINMAQARYGIETDFSLWKRLHDYKYVRQYYVDDLFLNMYIHR